MQHGGWMAEPRRCSADLKEDTPAGSHDHTRSLAQARATGLSYRIGDEGVVDRRCVACVPLMAPYTSLHVRGDNTPSVCEIQYCAIPSVWRNTPSVWRILRHRIPQDGNTRSSSPNGTTFSVFCRKFQASREECGRAVSAQLPPSLAPLGSELLSLASAAAGAAFLAILGPPHEPATHAA